MQGIKYEKMKKLVTTIIALFALSQISNSQIISKNEAFSVGEEFTLDAYYNLGLIWIKVGEADFKVEEEGENYKFTVTAHTFSEWDWIYSMNTLHVASCTKDMKPLYMWCKVHENGKYSEDRYDYMDKGTHYDVHRVAKNEKYHNGFLDTTFCMPYEAHDIINSVYVARNTDLSYNGGKDIPFYPIFGNSIHIMLGDVLGKKVIKTRAGEKYGCTKNIAKVGDGTIVDDKSPVYVYVTDDIHKIPVLVECKLSIGSVKVYLRSLKLK